MGTIPNPTGMDAVIVFEKKKLKMIFPNDVEVIPGQTVEWLIEPPELDAELFFDVNADSPFDWHSKKAANGKIKGTVKRDAVGLYKYSVTASGDTIDPRLRVRR